MFDLGVQELIVIFIVALLVFGPKRLPEIGRTLGKGLGELKRSMQGVKEQMDAELREIKQPVSLDAMLNTPPEPAVKAENPKAPEPHAAQAGEGEAPATVEGAEHRTEEAKTEPEAPKNSETGSQQGPKG